MVMLCEKINKADLPQFLGIIPKDKWVAEVKWDGDRIRLRVKDGISLPPLVKEHQWGLRWWIRVIKNGGEPCLQKFWKRI